MKEDYLFGGIWKLNNNTNKLIFENKKVTEIIENKKTQYDFELTDSLFYHDSSLIRSSPKEKLLVFKKNGILVFFYYLIVLTNDEMTLLSGTQLEPLTYSKKAYKIRNRRGSCRN